ncbi:MAG: RNA polymerase sigma factor [Chitinophagaceae bacterium]|jgi:RNA polymerase sigma factor (sigma-70 family)|uniref:RNA polymerase sigma factor n=1 Tax=unclassified Paraflavitalea TaxID=2798305 RepID=UPI003D342780|nr:RNA polymerase sigma factor [Chitinophagaceae bacterium]
MSDRSRERSVSTAVSKYGKQLFAFIRGKVNKLEDAEDILQDVWYQFSRLANVDELESVSGWLYSVSRNKITDLYRKKKPDLIDDFSQEDEDGALQLREMLLMDNNNHPEKEYFRELIWEELLKALNELPEKQRKVFVLNEMEDRTLQSIADEEGENLKTIISRKLYAVKFLRKKLEPLYHELYI